MGLFEKQHFLDLRVFGAIGFQDALNGLWLGKQGYLPRSGLLQRLVDSALARNVSVIGITTEDDVVHPGSPEDRFGFLMSKEMHLPESYTRQRITQNIAAVHIKHPDADVGDTVHLINAETIHAPEGADWKGLKLHVVGQNRFSRYAALADQAHYLCDEGLPTFLMNVGVSDDAERAADKALGYCTGVIGHDANNTFHPLWRFAPKVGRAIAKYTTDANARAILYAHNLEKPWIAVSSAHWMHQIGRAGITCDREELAFVPDESAILRDLARIITGRNQGYVLGRNANARVLQFGYWLGKYGSAPHRFEGDRLSSYNAPRQL